MVARGLDLSSHPEMTWVVGFHAQQAAEKALKAWLIWRQIDYPFSHDIHLLVSLCPGEFEHHPELIAAEELTRHAVESRYPGREPSVQDALRALVLAARVLEIVNAAIMAEDEDWTS